jgi:tetratricopeptide (TPR) repeat protein
MYLPLAAVIASGVLLVWRAIEPAPLSSRVAFQRAGFALAIVAVVLLVRTTRERNDDYQSAERLYRFTVSHQPHNARALNNLATLMIERREPGEAESYLRRALAVRPGYAEAQSNLGISVAMQGRAEEAIPLFAEAVRLEPDLSFAWRNYGEGLASLGRFHEALAAYRKALAANQDDIMSLERISWIQSTAPEAEIRDGAEAVRLALRATELTGKRDARALDVLAAALAETGNFVEATSTAERALTLARSAGQSELSSDIEYRIQVYRRGAPYREIPAQLPTPNSQLPKSPSR